MSENNDETLEILKLLVDKIQKLEQTVYDNDNVLMKAGLVKANTPSPKMQGWDGIVPDANTISKMSWDEINSLVTKIGGGVIWTLMRF